MHRAHAARRCPARPTGAPPFGERASSRAIAPEKRQDPDRGRHLPGGSVRAQRWRDTVPSAQSLRVRRPLRCRGLTRTVLASGRRRPHELDRDRNRSRARPHVVLRRRDGARLQPASPALPVDRRVRRLQPLRARAVDRRGTIFGARAAADRPGARGARAPPAGLRADRVAERARRTSRRGAPHARGPAHRQEAPGARPGRAVRRAPRMGSGRPVLPLPDQVDARARPGRPGDAAASLQRLGARARRGRPTARSRTVPPAAAGWSGR